VGGAWSSAEGEPCGVEDGDPNGDTLAPDDGGPNGDILRSGGSDGPDGCGVGAGAAGASALLSALASGWSFNLSSLGGAWVAFSPFGAATLPVLDAAGSAEVTDATPSVATTRIDPQKPVFMRRMLPETAASRKFASGC
jgi:hypothetical protein